MDLARRAHPPYVCRNLMYATGKSIHRNARDSSVGTILPKEAEEYLVLWNNSIRQGGPVSPVMLRLKAQEVAVEVGLAPD